MSLVPYSLAESVNADINTRTHYTSDAKKYNVPEFWAVADGEGDCEDFALGKRAALHRAGVERSNLRLAVCQAETGEGHGVLVVTTDRGQYVLDNRYPTPMARQDLPYVWLLIQVGRSWHAL